MQRLRCGVILTDNFVSYLEEQSLLHVNADSSEEERVEEPTSPVAILDYVKCAEGARAGTAYWSLRWGKSERGFKDWCLFSIGQVTIYMSRQTQLALKWKHIDYLDGKVYVPL